jgi:FkbM family methyltransferase
MKKREFNFRQSTKEIIDFAHMNTHRTISLWIENFIAIVRGKNIRFGYSNDKKCYVAMSDGLTRYFISRVRGYYLYRNGIKERGDFLCNSYCLNNIDFEKDDIVIDCGANYGDLLIFLNGKIYENNYLAIEPSPDDYRVLKMNAPNSKCFQYALGDESSETNFYLQSDDGDSSIVEPKKYTNMIKVEVIRLDELVSSLNVECIKLLKVEAEGYEPEVLQGAISAFPLIEYIAIDGGPERGVSNEQTFSNVTNVLLKNGFEMTDVYFPWYRALFKNKMRSI